MSNALIPEPPRTPCRIASRPSPSSKPPPCQDSRRPSAWCPTSSPPSPAAYGGYFAFTDALGKGTLTGREIELINLYTSELNGCGYCVSAHGTLAKRFELSEAELTAARHGRGRDEREDAMLALVQRVTRTGGGNTGAELERAKKAGLSDAAVIEVLAHVASKLFTNAVAQVAQTTIDFPQQPNLPRP